MDIFISSLFWNQGLFFTSIDWFFRALVGNFSFHGLGFDGLQRHTTTHNLLYFNILKSYIDQRSGLAQIHLSS